MQEKQVLMNLGQNARLLGYVQVQVGAKTFALEVNTTDPNALHPGAFNEVRATEPVVLGVHTGVYGYVPGTEAIGTNGTATATGKYEIGYVVDNETPTKNL